jgi:hypothetical protein
MRHAVIDAGTLEAVPAAVELQREQERRSAGQPCSGLPVTQPSERTSESRPFKPSSSDSSES